jgi:hypothetical protein
VRGLRLGDASIPRIGQTAMGSDDRYAAAAKKYSPERAHVLFVAEAPPGDIARYFYFERVERDDWLWIALMKPLYPSEWGQAKTERQRKEEWLLKFKRSQFRLIDACKTPIRGSNRERVKLIRSAAPGLIEEIKEIAPSQIVLIKATVHEALFQKLSDARFPVVNGKSLPFPCSGQQTNFHDEFRRLVDTGVLRLNPSLDASQIPTLAKNARMGHPQS